MKELIEYWEKYSQIVDYNNQQLAETCEGMKLIEGTPIDYNRQQKTFEGFMDYISGIK